MSAQQGLYTRWSRDAKRSGFFRAGERVGVAVSGGADSVLLLDFMKELAPEIGFILSVVHFNHHLRGEESNADERFVVERAHELGIECLRGEDDVGRIAREKNRNLEATARELRYRFFYSLISQGTLDKIATAHTANDQAETVLLRLLRGTGSRGLGGIYPVLDGKIIRPFLDIRRAEIEAEIKTRKIDYRTDLTNNDASFQRNKVRKELIPFLEKGFSPDVVSLLNELSGRARDEEDFLEQQARERARPWRVHERGTEKIPVKPLSEFPPAIARRILRQMVATARGDLRGISHRHIEALRHLAMEAQSGRRLVLPGGIEARRDFNWLTLKRKSDDTYAGEYAYPVEMPGEVLVRELGVTFEFKIIGSKELEKEYNKLDVPALDPHKLREKLTVRNWRAGDRFQPLGSSRVHKLKEVFGRRKISAAERASWPVLVCGNEIAWVRGFPPAAPLAATSESDQVLVILETAR